MNTLKCDTLIIGGGIAGAYLASNIPGSTVISQEFGGLLSSYKQDGFTFDNGGHAYTLGDAYLRKLMGLVQAEIHDRVAVFTERRKNSIEFADYPMQSAHADIIRPTKYPAPPRNLYHWSLQNFGREFTLQYFDPFNRRVWTTETRQLDFDWIDGRVQPPSELKTKGWGPNSEFWYAPGQQIVDMHLAKAEDVGLVKGKLLAVSIPEKMAIVELPSEIAFFSYETLIDTTGYFMRESTNEVFLVGIGFDLVAPYNFFWAYGHKEQYVHRIIYLSKYHTTLAPSGCSSFLMEIPFNDNYPLRGPLLPVYRAMKSHGGLKNEFVYDTVVKLLETFGTPMPKKNIATLWARKIRGYPIPTVGSRARVAEVKRNLLAKDILVAGRWGTHGYFNLEHIFMDGNSVLDQMGTDEPLDQYLKSTFYYKERKA